QTVLVGVWRGGVEKPNHRHRPLLRASREWPRCRAAQKRDELPPLQSIELHSVPASQGRITGYRIAEDQSAGVLEFCNQSWCRPGRATTSPHNRTMNAQI